MAKTVDIRRGGARRSISRSSSSSRRQNEPRRSRNMSPNYRVDIEMGVSLDETNSENMVPTNKKRRSITRRRPRINFDLELQATSSRLREINSNYGAQSDNDHEKEDNIPSTSTSISTVEGGTISHRSSSKKAPYKVPRYVTEKLQDHQVDNEDCKDNTIRTIISWLINMKMVNELCRVKLIVPAAADPIVSTHEGRRVIKTGRVTRIGINCDCCKEMLTVYGFQLHGGTHHVERPFENIYVFDTNVSLYTYLLEAWNKELFMASFGGYNYIKKRTSDPYDDACVICADGGNLTCCDAPKCHSTYHASCLGLKQTPPGKWYCPYCCCKYCESSDNRVDILFTCFQCQKRYHPRCSQNDQCSPQSAGKPFCGDECRNIYAKLDKIVGQKMRLKDNVCWTLIRRMDLESGPIISDVYLRTIYHSKIALAAELMEDAFDPIVDRHTKIDVIKSVVFNCGSNFQRIDFSRFYTAILEEKDEIVSAATLRIHGRSVAEMPFIATTEDKRGKGHCRELLGAVETTLQDLGVERLVIPSAEEITNTWMAKFSFTWVDDATVHQLRKCKALMFPFSKRLMKMVNGPIIKLPHNLNLDPPDED